MKEILVLLKFFGVTTAIFFGAILPVLLFGLRSVWFGYLQFIWASAALCLAFPFAAERVLVKEYAEQDPGLVRRMKLTRLCFGGAWILSLFAMVGYLFTGG